MQLINGQFSKGLESVKRFQSAIQVIKYCIASVGRKSYQFEDRISKQENIFQGQLLKDIFKATREYEK